jgi:hypothetical protein
MSLVEFGTCSVDYGEDGGSVDGYEIWVRLRHHVRLLPYGLSELEARTHTDAMPCVLATDGSE